MTSVMGQYLTGQVPVSGSEPSSLKEKFNIREGRAYSSFKLVLRIYSHKTEGIYPGTNMVAEKDSSRAEASLACIIKKINSILIL